MSILSKNRAAVPDLQTTNIEVTYRNKPARVKSLDREGGFSRVILLLDTSASMRATINETLDLAEYILSTTPSGAPVGVALFSQELQPVSLPTTNHEQLQNQLEALRTRPKAYSGKTAVWDAIGSSVSLFDLPKFGDTVIIISDGDDNRSKQAPDEALQLLESAGIRLFAIQVPELASAPNQYQLRLVTPLNKMASDTGGTLSNLEIPWKGRFSFHRQSERIFSLYRLEIALPEAIDDRQDWKLELVGLSKAETSDLIVTYPHKLARCP